MSTQEQTPVLTKDYVKSRLDLFKLGSDSESLSKLGWIENISLSGPKVHLSLQVPEAVSVEALKRDIKVFLQKDPLIDFAHVETKPQEMPLIPENEIKHMIAVASGKGGVGKSTVSVNLAISLAKLGKKVGILDADIYGPSLPMMLGLEKDLPQEKIEAMEPLQKYGIKIMSIGFLVPSDKAIVWRGPMLHSAINQFINQVLWGQLDYLIIDLPPGTGDAQLSISQSATLKGALIVSSPQRVAEADAIRAAQMFDQVKIPVLGVVQNMSQTAQGGGFPGNAGTSLSERIGCPLLATLPFDQSISQSGDSGTPIATDETNQASEVFIELAKGLESSLGDSKDFPSLELKWEN